MHKYTFLCIIPCLYVCFCTKFVFILSRIFAQKLWFLTIKKWRKKNHVSKKRLIKYDVLFQNCIALSSKMSSNGACLYEEVELREDIFQVICFFTYVCDSMYTCLFRRISRHRFRCGCVTGVMFCDKRIYIEQTLYILSNVTFWGNILTVPVSFIGVCLEPIYTYTLRDVRRCMILILQMRLQR